MTVRELIAALQQHDPDATIVTISDSPVIEGEAREIAGQVEAGWCSVRRRIDLPYPSEPYVVWFTDTKEQAERDTPYRTEVFVGTKKVVCID
jgi:hypothetical protein